MSRKEKGVDYHNGVRFIWGKPAPGVTDEELNQKLPQPKGFRWFRGIVMGEWRIQKTLEREANDPDVNGELLD